jgi:hypothetical protein
MSAPLGELLPLDALFVGDSIWVDGVGEGNVLELAPGNPAAGSTATIVTDLGEIPVFDGDLFDRIDTSPFRGEALTLF